MDTDKEIRELCVSATALVHLLIYLCVRVGVGLYTHACYFTRHYVCVHVHMGVVQDRADNLLGIF